MNEKTYLNITRAFCFYDIIALAPFAVPWLAVFQLNTFASIQQALNLPGAPIMAVGPNELVFFNMLGIVGVGWSVWRLRNLTVEIGIFEGWARVAFFCTMFYFAFVGGVSAIVIVFGLIDIVGAGLHLNGYRLQSN